MKKTVIVFFLLLLSSLSIAAQEKRLSSSPQAFRTFFAAFKKTVEKGDRSGVAAMTSFPFEYGFDAGDEGKMSRSQFIKRFSEIFGKHPKNFLPERNPVFSRGDDGSYQISTEDASHYSFKKLGGKFRFMSYMVEP